MAIQVPEFSRLLILLNDTKTQVSNAPLWIFLNRLVVMLVDLGKALATSIAATENTTNAFSLRSYLTTENETPYLPFSRQLLPGTNVTFDDAVEGERTVNVLIPSGGVSGPIPFRELRNELRLPWVPAAPATPPTAVAVTHPPGIVIGNGSTVITTGVKGIISLPYAGTIRGVKLLSSDPSITSCSIVIDIKKTSYASFPSSFTSICAAALPTLSTGNKYSDTTLSGWTTTFAAFDVFEFVVNSVTGALQVTLVLDVTGPN